MLIVQDGVEYSETRHPGPRGYQNQVNFIYDIVQASGITVYITKRINFATMICDHYTCYSNGSCHACVVDVLQLQVGGEEYSVISRPAKTEESSKVYTIIYV